MCARCRPPSPPNARSRVRRNCRASRSSHRRASMARGCRPTAAAWPGCATKDAIARCGWRRRRAARRCARWRTPMRRNWRGRATGAGCSCNRERQVFALAMAGQAGSGAIAKLGGRWPRTLLGADPVAAGGDPRARKPADRLAHCRRRWRVFRIDAHGKRNLAARRHAADCRCRLRCARAPRVLHARGRCALHGVSRARARRSKPALQCVDLARCALLAASADGRAATLLTDVGSNFRRLARLEADDTLHDAARRSARRGRSAGCRDRSAHAATADRRLSHDDRREPRPDARRAAPRRAYRKRVGRSATCASMSAPRVGWCTNARRR